jgi:hypothetical protein
MAVLSAVVACRDAAPASDLAVNSVAVGKALPEFSAIAVIAMPQLNISPPMPSRHSLAGSLLPSPHAMAQIAAVVHATVMQAAQPAPLCPL